MRGIGSRIIQLLCVGCLLLAMTAGLTQGVMMMQSARNDFEGNAPVFSEVTLTKLKRDLAGEPTTDPLEGVEFYLFEVGPGGTLTQIGGRYLTDIDGKITVTLPPGDYCFIETCPVSGYTYDRDSLGNELRRYDFTVADDEEPVPVTAYNLPVTGDLTVEKAVVNADGSPLTHEQLALDFTFTVTFSDGGAYAYRVKGRPPAPL